MSVIKVALEITINLLILLIPTLAIGLLPETYSEQWKTSSMELFVKIVNSFNALFSQKGSWIFDWFLTATLNTDKIPTKLFSHDFPSKLASPSFNSSFSSVTPKKETFNNLMEWGRGTNERHDPSVLKKVWQFKVTALLVLYEIRWEN